MSGPELHEVLRCFGLDVPLEQCADIIRDFMRDHKDFASGGLDHAEFVRFVLELDNPDEFKHIGAGGKLCRGLRLTHNDDEKHLARIEELKIIREKKNADAAGDIAVLVAACRKDASNISKIEKLMRMKDVGRSGTINLRHFIDIITESFGGDVSVTNARRLAGIFDENMVGYVSYEMLLDKIRQQLASATYDAASLPATPGSRSPEARVDLIKAEFGEEKRMRELSDKIRLKIAGKIRNGSSEFRKAFEMLDRDGSGAIAFDELSHVVQRILGISIPEKVAAKLFQAIDKNKNGNCLFIQFVLHLPHCTNWVKIIIQAKSLSPNFRAFLILPLASLRRHQLCQALPALSTYDHSQA
jgi:Ca2+-binding EF-hand superfamily protein